MRILVVWRIYPRDASPGIGLNAYYLARYIEEPHLYITKRIPGRPIDVPPHVELAELEYPEPAPLEERISRRRYVAYAVSRLVGASVFLSRSKPLIERFHPDLVHVHTPLALGHGIWTKRRMGTPVVLTFHGTDLLRTERSRSVRFAIRRWVDSITYVASTMEADLRRLFPDTRLLYTPSGVDLAEFFPGDESRRGKRWIAVGNLRWQKGYEHLLEAAALVRREHADWTLAIVGEGQERPRLEALIREAGLSGTVELLGTRSRSEVGRLLRESSLFVLSSVSEGFPKVLLEAMASGLPVVTTDVGNCREIVADGGIVVASRDARGLAAAAGELMGDPGRRAEMGRQGRERAARYDWRSIARDVRREYEALLGGRSAAATVGA